MQHPVLLRRGAGLCGHWFYASDTIFREGSLGNFACILKERAVEISTRTEERESVLGVPAPVSVFGEMALLLKDHRRIATAKALEYSELVKTSRKSFENFVESSPTFIRMILTTLTERLGDAHTRIMHAPDPCFCRRP
jgi:CRP-like cAMP-binding protein